MKNYTYKIGWIDTLRFFAMFLVIVGHCSYYNIITPYGGIEYYQGEDSSFMFKLINAGIGFIYIYHMPLFMAISGACFFYSSSKHQGFINFIRIKGKRLIIPFFVVTTVLSVPMKYLSGYYDGSENIIRDIIYGQYLLLGNSHLWYVVSLFYIYIASYFIEKYHVNRSFLFWLLLVFCSWIGFYIEDFLFQFLGVTGLLKYLFFFQMGCMFVERYSKKEETLFQNLLSWLIMIVTWFALVYSIKLCISNANVILRMIKIPYALWGILNMLFLCKWINENINLKKSRVIVFLSRNTYELYLYSDPFNYLLIFLLMGGFGNAVFYSNKYSLLAFIIRFVGTILFSMIIAYIKEIIERKRRRKCIEI